MNCSRLEQRLAVRADGVKRSKAVWLALPALLLATASAQAQTSDVGTGFTPDLPPVAVTTNGLAAGSAPVNHLNESVVAKVNDDMISSYDLRQRVRLLVATTGVQPTAENLPQIEREALRALVDEHLEMQEIKDVEKKQKDLHLEPSDKEIDQTIGDMAKQAGVTHEKLLATLREDDVDISTLRDQLRARLAWERYIGARFHDNVQIGDNQVRAAFQEANANASKPQYLVSEIFIDAGQVGGIKQAEDGARQLIAQMQQGAPFAAVARQFSTLPTAANGGDTGWVTGADLPPEIQTAVEQMRPGQLSQPIPVANGVYVVALRDKRAGADATVVDLKQAAVSLPQDADAAEVRAAESKLETLRGKITGCETLETVAGNVKGVVAGDLGETEVKDLRPSFQQAIAHLSIGEVSQPVRTDAGLHLIVLCERRASGSRAITRADIEDKLRGEQYDMFSRRFLRDLRNSATIETR